MEYNNDFRYDLKVGQISERMVGDLLCNKTIEVKADKIAKRTGNVFIEYESRGKPSGIAKTEAEFYCFVVEDLVVFIPTEKLKTLIKKHYKTRKDVHGGDSNTSRGILVSLVELVQINQK